MGTCNTSEGHKTLHFQFEDKSFGKKLITRQVPLSMPVSNLFNHFYTLTSKSPKDFIFALKIKHKLHLSTSSARISDLSLSNKEKVKVFVIPKKNSKTCLNFSLICCSVTSISVEIPAKTTTSELKSLIFPLKSCCQSKVSQIILNNCVLSDSQDLLLTKSDRVQVTFGEIQLKTHWKTFSPGLNLKSTCFNSACSCYKQQVVIQKHFGRFSLSEDEDYPCPSCSSSLSVKPCLTFLSCEIEKENSEQILVRSTPTELRLDSSFKLTPLNYS